MVRHTSNAQNASFVKDFCFFHLILLVFLINKGPLIQKYKYVAKCITISDVRTVVWGSYLILLPLISVMAKLLKVYDICDSTGAQDQGL